MKLSAGKVSTPGRKQIFRARNAAGTDYSDLVGLVDESVATMTREFRQPPATVAAIVETHMECGRRKLPRPAL